MTKPIEQSDYIDEEDEGVVDSPRRILHLEIPQSQRGERMDKVLSQLLPEFSRSRIQNWIEQGLVIRNGEKLNSKDSTWGGEMVSVEILKQPQDDAFTPQDIPLDVIYEDRSILVINKPAGLVVHPAAGNWTGTLLNGLLHHYPDCGLVPRAGIVHRLDKDTSGLLVIARTLEAQTDLVRQLQERTVSRHYITLVWGKFAPSKIIREPIGRDPKDRLKMAVVANNSGKPAVTHVKSLAQVEYQGATLSLLLCKLETGRTHQIRVHLEHAGFPLFNDPIYKRKVPQAVFEAIKNKMKGNFELQGQALHAAILGLKHPQSHQDISWQVDPPKALLTIFEYLGISEASWRQIYTKNLWT